MNMTGFVHSHQKERHDEADSSPLETPDGQFKHFDQTLPRELRRSTTAAALPPWRRQVSGSSFCWSRARNKEERRRRTVFCRATLNFHCFSATAKRCRNRSGKSFWRSLRGANRSRANFAQSIEPNGRCNSHMLLSRRRRFSSQRSPMGSTKQFGSSVPTFILKNWFTKAC
jgi:hypothetical protein